MKYTVENIADGKIVFESDSESEFIKWTNKIIRENEDEGWITIFSAEEAEDYITSYCDNLSVI